MIKRKDNLTDVIEQLPKVETVNVPKPPEKKPEKKPEQTVIGNGGETITLGQKSDKK